MGTLTSHCDLIAWQLQIAVRLGYLSAEAGCVGQAIRVGKLITGLRNALRVEVS